MKWLQSKRWKRIIWALLGVVLATISYGLLQLIEPVRLAPIATPGQVPPFEGQMLLVASDADMVATAYADARLDRVSGVEDALSVLKLPLDASEPAVASVQVSNS
ncbi:MAG: hypothetical protein AAFO87_07865 [Cyanobacteria bacterium J06607_6]